MEITENEFVQILIEGIKAVPGSKKIFTAGNKQSIVRCPYCGDSKNKSNQHLYIKLSMPSYFFCQRCGTAGLTDNDLFADLNTYHPDLISLLAYVNRHIKKFRKQLSTTTFKKNIFVNNPVNSSIGMTEIPENGFKIPDYNLDDAFYVKRIAYLESRLGIKITNEVCKKYKIILDTDVFFEFNKIVSYTTKPEYLDNLLNYYIGFITSDSNFIICRDFTDQQKMRYIDYNITGTAEKRGKHYAIVKEISLLEPELTLNITEGIFDAIAVNNLVEKDSPSNVFVAANGKTFLNIINTFFKLGFLNLKINIFCDSDTSAEYFKDMLLNSKLIKSLRPNISLYYNNNRDDFGAGVVEGFDIKKITIQKASGQLADTNIVGRGISRGNSRQNITSGDNSNTSRLRR
jgi:hypothetical protein